MQIVLQNIPFTLLLEKALWKEDERLLIIADIHLGKARHFRKEGIPMPALSQETDYKNLRSVLDKTQPEKVYFLGDLFHSSFNKDWMHFEAFIREYKNVQFTLVKGNHDLINEKLFKELGIQVEKQIEDEHFIYSHKPLIEDTEKLNIAGHIHPGISLNGIARQYAKMPCFYLHENTFILPAFGALTGLYILEKIKSASIYAVLADEVRKI